MGRNWKNLKIQTRKKKNYITTDRALRLVLIKAQKTKMGKFYNFLEIKY